MPYTDKRYRNVSENTDPPASGNQNISLLKSIVKLSP
jgi:hypothetical protein